MGSSHSKTVPVEHSHGDPSKVKRGKTQFAKGKTHPNTIQSFPSEHSPPGAPKPPKSPKPTKQRQERIPHHPSQVHIRNANAFGADPDPRHVAALQRHEQDWHKKQTLQSQAATTRVRPANVPPPQSQMNYYNNKALPSIPDQQLPPGVTQKQMTGPIPSKNDRFMHPRPAPNPPSQVPRPNEVRMLPTPSLPQEAYANPPAASPPIVRPAPPPASEYSSTTHKSRVQGVIHFGTNPKFIPEALNLFLAGANSGFTIALDEIMQRNWDLYKCKICGHAIHVKNDFIVAHNVEGCSVGYHAHCIRQHVHQKYMSHDGVQSRVRCLRCAKTLNLRVTHASRENPIGFVKF